MTTVLDAPVSELVSSIDPSSTVKEIWTHMRRYHAIPWHLNSKSRKADILAVHESHHTMPLEPERRSPIRIPHDHMPPVITVPESDFKTIEKNANAKVPAPGSLAGMSATDRRALEQIIKSDYDTLAQQVLQAAQVYRAQKRGELAAAWQAKQAGLTKAQTDLAAVQAKAQALVNTMLDKLSAKGYVPAHGRRAEVHLPALTITGYDDALHTVETEVQESVRRAQSIITVKRNAAMRSILMATVSAEAANAAALSVPDVESVLGEARKQAALAIEAGAVAE